MTDQQKQALRILKSWHLVEFFQPYNLEKNDKSIRITQDELIRCGNALLPWLNKSARQQLKIPAREVRYILHLGLFDKAQVSQISERVFGAETDPVKLHDLEQRLDTEGTTCFAKLILDAYGTPNFGELSVSTLPWALGHLQNGSAHTLSFEMYRNHCELLEEQLDRIAQRLLSHPFNNERPTLCASALDTLLQTLHQWAGFTPQSAFAVQLDWNEFKKNSDALIHHDPALLPHQYQDDHAEDNNADDDNESEVECRDDPLLPILNSFYIEDIERAMVSIANGEGGDALLNYLSIAQHKYPDLYTQEGLEPIISHLDPDVTPLGRWPANPQHGMSLMQQFAINTAVVELHSGGLVSVNGPPGTGKTTLLRDLVAHNMVERAKILAGFKRVSQTLDRQGFLVEPLKGFEMVVASSNNAAVENISRELPQLKSLGEDFKTLDYLKPVANQVNASKKSRKYQPLTSEQQCWGMIAATLGKKSNRVDFTERFFFDKHFEPDSDAERKRPPEYNFLNLWRWRKCTAHPSFTEARKHFNAVLNKVQRQQQFPLKKISQ
jgi:hypothetical protein